MRAMRPAKIKRCLMKNVALLLTILLMTGLWSFAQVAPEPQPRPRPQPAVEPAPAVAPAPADIVEIRVEDPAVDYTIKKAQYDKAFKAQLVDNFAPYKQKLEKGSYV